MSEFAQESTPSSSSSSASASTSTSTSTSEDSSSSAEELKKLANELFLANRFAEARDLYSRALSACSCASSKADGETESETESESEKLRVLLYTNRAAALLGLHQYEEALEDANRAISLDPSWTKAYYRKSSALESLGRVREMYETWVEAGKFCENNQLLVKQVKAAQLKWLKVFRKADYPVVSSEDLLRRFDLFVDKRERLSTLAHFWNESDQEERLSFFILLISVIGGESAVSPQNRELFSPEIMIELPLNNYQDLPRARLANWFDFFRSLTGTEKGVIFRTVWDHLTAEEKNDVIVDMRQFLAGSLSGHQDMDVPDL